MNLQNKISRIRENWIFDLAVELFVLTIVSTLLVIGSTWASVSSEHMLTYTANKLTWDKNTKTNKDGSAQLDVFKKLYEGSSKGTNVNSENSDKLIAPGTSNFDTILLKNTVDHQIAYTAIAYFIRNDKCIPVTMSFDGTDLLETSDYKLPEGVNKKNVIKAVTGKVKAASQQDFTFRWKWDFETENQESDPSDTRLGNDASDGKDEAVKVGFYIIVEDEGETITPPSSNNDTNTNTSSTSAAVDYSTGTFAAKTGDTTNIQNYLVLVMISGVMLSFLFIYRRKHIDKVK